MKSFITILFSVFLNSALLSQGLTYEPSKPKIKPYSPDSLLKESNRHLGMGIFLKATGPSELITGSALVMISANIYIKKIEGNLFYSIGEILIIAGTMITIAGPIAISIGRKEKNFTKSNFPLKHTSIFQLPL